MTEFCQKNPGWTNSRSKRMPRSLAIWSWFTVQTIDIKISKTCLGTVTSSGKQFDKALRTDGGQRMLCMYNLTKITGWLHDKIFNYWFINYVICRNFLVNPVVSNF